MTDVLGKLSCLDIPDFNGDSVIYSTGGIVSAQMDTTANLPSPGVLGRLYINTDSNKFFRDNGASWVDLTTPADIIGTVNQIAAGLAGTTVTLSLASNPIIPGLERLRLPVGPTADRPAVPAAGDHRFNSELGAPELFNASDWLPYGKIVQHFSGQIASISGTAQIPLDTSIPQIGEGFQVSSLVFTPAATVSSIIYEAEFVASNSNANRAIIAALFLNGGAGAVSASVQWTPAANSAQQIHVKYVLSSTDKSAKTFALRIGANGSGTTYLGSAGTNTLGGIINRYFRITEII